MTDFETVYIFCKDNRLVLIVECLFAKASTSDGLFLNDSFILNVTQDERVISGND